MKYLLTICIALAISFAAFAQDNDDTDISTIEYTVTSESSSNFRSGPGTNFEISGTVESGETILIYDEEPEVAGWLRVYREGEEDVYIANFLVERAPMRFYSIEQEPLVVFSGTGQSISVAIELPQGAYRLDVNINDNSFILKTITLEGDCRDRSILNELDFDRNRLNVSALLVSRGCTLIFESDNVDGDWTVEIRDMLDMEYLLESALIMDEVATISATGRQVTMATVFQEDGIWTIEANVQDNAFILRPQVLLGNCEGGSVFNEFADEPLELSTVYRVEGDSGEEGCVVFWESSNVEGDWEITFTKLR